MAIPIVKEPDAYSHWDAEPCCFCHQPTRFWTALPERSAGEQVACCPFCADTFEPDAVPTKDEWFDYHAAQTRAREGL